MRNNKTTRSSINRAFLAASLMGLAYLVPGNAQAQSFSCARAQIPTELAICNNEDLLILDEELALLFADKRIMAANLTEVKLISNDQKEWLRQRNACTLDFKCLEKQYVKRIKAIQRKSRPIKTAIKPVAKTVAKPAVKTVIARTGQARTIR